MRPDTPPVCNGITGLCGKTGESGKTVQTQTLRGLQPDGMSHRSLADRWSRQFDRFYHFACVNSFDAATSKSCKPDVNGTPVAQR